FVYGRRGFDSADCGPRKFPARQTYEACAALARNHKLRPDRVLFLKQNPEAIDAGAFHNDVVAVRNLDVMFLHELAYSGDWKSPLVPWARADGIYMPAGRNELPLGDVVQSYLFNSQLVTLPDGRQALIAPTETQTNTASREYILSLGKRIDIVHYIDVR